MSTPTQRSARPPCPRDGQPRGQIRPRAGPSITRQRSNPTTVRLSSRHQRAGTSTTPRRVVPALELTAPQSTRSASGLRRLAREQAKSSEEKPRPATTGAPTSGFTTCRAQEAARAATRTMLRRLPPSAIRTPPMDTRRQARHARVPVPLHRTPLAPLPWKAPVRRGTLAPRGQRAASLVRRSRADRRQMTLAEMPTQPPRPASRIHPPRTVPARRSTRCLGANQHCR
jgi:hypothetical protein